MTSRDRELLDRWTTAGDAQAFDTLVSVYSGLVFSACRRVLRDERAAEDMTQECFLQLAYKTPEIRTSLGAWLHKVATRQSLNEARHETRLKRREQEYSESTSLSVEMGWDDIQVFIDEAVDALPDDLRVPIVASFLERKTHAVIATEMGLGRSTVSQRIEKGINAIRDELKENGVKVASTSLAGMLTAQAVEAAPVGLAAALAKIALAGEGVHVVKGGVTGGGLFGGSSLVTGLVITTVLTMIGIGAWLTSEIWPTDDARLEEPSQAVRDLGTVKNVEDETFAAPEIKIDDQAMNVSGPSTRGLSGQRERGTGTAESKADDGVKNTVQGRLVDSARNVGIPDATMEVYAKGDPQRSLLSVLTGADGSFLFDPLDPGVYELVPGNLTAYPETKQKRTRVEFQIGNVEFTPVIQDVLLSRGGSMKGYVYLGEKPLVNAHVEVWSTAEEGFLEPFDIYTDAEGHYSVEGLGNFRGAFQPRRTRANGTRHNGLGVPAEIKSNEVTEANFDFIDGTATIEGTIYYENVNTPVQASLKIYFGWMEDGHYIEEQILAKTDSEGFYVAEGLPAGLAEMHIRPTGVGSGVRRIEKVTLKPGQRAFKDIVISDVKVHARVKNIWSGTQELFVFAFPGEEDIQLRGVEDFVIMRDKMVAVQQYGVQQSGTFSGLLKGLKPGRYTITATAWPCAYDGIATREYGYENLARDLQLVSEFITIKETDQDINLDLVLPSR